MQENFNRDNNDLTPQSVLSALFNFDVMITSKLIKVIYFILIILVILSGIRMLFTRDFYGGTMIIPGLLTIVLGPFAVRIWAELMIVLFNISDNLAAIRRHIGE
ncbi:MAG: DUF4282 domain-containing protein [Peptostreptococcaceae bacterium]|nr:DUF4282 domain-containing protein [Peptostreptococcaceae bacterium]